MIMLPLALRTEGVEAASLNPLFSRLTLNCRTGSPMLNVIKSGKVRNVPLLLSFPCSFFICC